MLSLSRAFDWLFVSSEEQQLKLAFQRAADAVRSNDMPTLKAVLSNTRFNEQKNQNLLAGAIEVNNVEGLEAVLHASGMDASQKLTISDPGFLVTEILDTPMLPYAISLGKKEVSRFLALRPDTDLQARPRLTISCTFACPATGTTFADSEPLLLKDAETMACESGMTDVTEIIRTRIKATQSLD
jgi:hypothetical protein